MAHSGHHSLPPPSDIHRSVAACFDIQAHSRTKHQFEVHQGHLLQKRAVDVQSRENRICLWKGTRPQTVDGPYRWAENRDGQSFRRVKR